MRKKEIGSKLELVNLHRDVDYDELRDSISDNQIIDGELKDLSKEEAIFCELYINGDSGYAGSPKNCYIAAFSESKNNHFDTTPALLGRKLLKQPRISQRIQSLIAERDMELETIAVKLQVTESLKAIVEETSTAIYLGKNGKPASPAPLRSVAVTANKALMDLYPIKAKQGDDDKGDQNQPSVTFNVIMPQPKVTEDENK